ncbi:MAG TPA: molybdenum cofactor guanylyltransferase [Methanosarcina sp.]|nr:molybdenum cofactor guanylyltransferase [Methanosarcina sp.]
MGEKTEIKEGMSQKKKINSRSAVILAGGKGRRMGIVEKSLLEFEGKTVLERLLESLFHTVDEVVLSVRDNSQKEKFSKVVEKFSAREIRFCFDTVEDAGPLEGIRAGLLESRAEYSFVCAGDMPFVNFRVVNLLFEKAEGHNAALPKWDNERFEPLHAVYSKKLIPEIEKAFENGKNVVLAPVFEMQDVVFVEISEIKKLDPDLRTFVNLNVIEDLESLTNIGFRN